MAVLIVLAGLVVFGVVLLAPLMLPGAVVVLAVAGAGIRQAPPQRPVAWFTLKDGEGV